MLNAVIKTHLESNASIPTADDLKHNIYVDNVIDGAKSDEKAVSYYNDANHLMQSCGFKLRSWTSNSERLCELAKQDDIYEPSRDVPVLGLRWEPESDTMTYSENNSEPIPNELITKRDVLSSSATLYDPLGFVAPVHIRAKLFVQSLWKRGLPWDEPLDAELNSQWIQIAADLNATRKTTINRQYFSGNKDNDDCEVHVFADASTTAYGAVVYLRSSSETSIVMAKARVAPTSDLSLPRLELMAALIGTRLSKFVINALSGKINITQRYLWSDSQIALYWINSVKKLPIFVSNRVREINGFRHIYKYCPSADNPADLLTRGITSDQLANSTLWWNGPTWLKENGDWPICELFDSAVHHIATTDDFMIEPHTQIDAEVANKMQHVEDLSRRSTENIAHQIRKSTPQLTLAYNTRWTLLVSAR
ncbi:uncharacterized protein [Ptychodera flava]|uniref:uncharacterized protein n=1 Tax=Ptychodera flava TaxID=63121 RepID=UPI00396A1F26